MRVDWSRFDRDAAGRFRADLLDLVRERAGGDVALVATAVGQAIDRAGPAWRGSKVTLVPESSDSPYSDTYINSVTVKVAGLPLTLFPSRLRQPDDLLEYGDRDFFGRDADADADYFTLVQELQTPNSTARQAGKLLTLYTARPSKDRARLLRKKALPAGVFLTSSRDRAVGLAEDLGGERDVWRVRLYGSQVVRTLDAGRESEYQVVPTDSGVAPVAYLELLAEGVKVQNPKGQTYTPAFKRWFGNSKVVDANGDPLVVYHGTNRGIHVFDPNVGINAPVPKSVYFSDDPNIASWVAKNRGSWEEGGKVIAAYLRIENPLVIDAKGAHAIHLTDQVASLLRRDHDGVIIKNVREFFGDEWTTTFAVFSPTQIKSATGNRGTFDPSDPDIRHNPAPLRTFIPPAAVADEARLGLAIRAQQPPSQRCCTPVGLRRASQLANRQPVSVRTLKRMRSYFQRHAVDAQGARWDDPYNPSKGKVAWLIWGGDAGRKWCNSILDELGD